MSYVPAVSPKGRSQSFLVLNDVTFEEVSLLYLVQSLKLSAVAKARNMVKIMSTQCHSQHSTTYLRLRYPD